MSGRSDDEESWELPAADEPEPEWAEQIRERRRRRGDRYRREMVDEGGRRAEPPVEDDPARRL